MRLASLKVFYILAYFLPLREENSWIFVSCAIWSEQEKNRGLFSAQYMAGFFQADFWQMWSCCYIYTYVRMVRYEGISNSKRLICCLKKVPPHCWVRHIFLVYFRVSLRLHGTGFSPSPSIVWQVSLLTGRLTNSPTLHLYTGPVNRVIQPVKKEIDFASKVPERESNSSYTAWVDPFPATLSTIPRLLLLETFADFTRLRSLSAQLAVCPTCCPSKLQTQIVNNNRSMQKQWQDGFAQNVSEIFVSGVDKLSREETLRIQIYLTPILKVSWSSEEEESYCTDIAHYNGYLNVSRPYSGLTNILQKNVQR